MEKTRKELEKEIKVDNILLVVFAGIIIFVMIIGFIFILNEMKLKEELIKCKAQIPVWTLTISCSYSWIDWNSSIRFDSYEEYKNALDNIGENCEIIE